MRNVPKGYSIAKTLLEYTNEVWTAKALASLSGVSPKTCYQQIKNLLGRGLIIEEQKGFYSVKDPLSLRQYLEDNHKLPLWAYFFSPEAPEYFSKRVDETATRLSLDYVITGELGLWAYHQHIQPIRTHILVPKKFEKEWRRRIESDLLAVICPPTRATIFLSSTTDPYPFIRYRKIGQYRVPPFVQVYLDCRDLGARLAEGATDAWHLIMR